MVSHQCNNQVVDRDGVCVCERVSSDSEGEPTDRLQSESECFGCVVLPLSRQKQHMLRRQVKDIRRQIVNDLSVVSMETDADEDALELLEVCQGLQVKRSEEARELSVL
eukprot:6465634-Amphidinium_carterae.1